MKSYNSLSVVASQRPNSTTTILKSFFRLYKTTTTSAQLLKIWKSQTTNYVKLTHPTQFKLKSNGLSRFLSGQGQLFLLLHNNFQLTSIKCKFLLSWTNKILQSLLFLPSFYVKKHSLVQNELVSFKKTSLFL